MARRRTSGKKRNPYQGDPLTKAAKADGFAARSVFKLEEIHRRFRVIRQARRVVDLGCSPGSWAQFVMQKLPANGKLVGVDINPPAVSGFTFIERSVLDVPAEDILAALEGQADVVLSDMAPLTTGNKLGDHVAQLELADRALLLATRVLRPGGSFVVKVFDGEDTSEFVTRAKAHFAKTKRVRPEAVRTNSREFYLVCLEFSPAG
jgi:23S rRNA (uridine2552-2'-O)-methyltransferase